MNFVTYKNEMILSFDLNGTSFIEEKKRYILLIIIYTNFNFSLFLS